MLAPGPALAPNYYRSIGARYQEERSKPKRVTFFCNGDQYFNGKVVNITPNRYISFNHLLNDLTSKLPTGQRLPYGVRQVFTPKHGHRIRNIEQFQDGGCYVCAGFETFKPTSYRAQNLLEPWHATRKEHAAANAIGRATFGDNKAIAANYNRFHPNRHGLDSEDESQVGNYSEVFFRTGPSIRYRQYYSQRHYPAPVQRTKPRLITVVRLGSKPRNTVKILLNKEGVKSFENLLDDISEAFGTSNRQNPVRKLFSTAGQEIGSVNDFFRGDVLFVAAGIKEHPREKTLDDILEELQAGADAPLLQTRQAQQKRADARERRPAAELGRGESGLLLTKTTNNRDSGIIDDVTTSDVNANESPRENEKSERLGVEANHVDQVAATNGSDPVTAAAVPVTSDEKQSSLVWRVEKAKNQAAVRERERARKKREKRLELEQKVLDDERKRNLLPKAQPDQKPGVLNPHLAARTQPAGALPQPSLNKRRPPDRPSIDAERKKRQQQQTNSSQEAKPPMPLTKASHSPNRRAPDADAFLSGANAAAPQPAASESPAPPTDVKSRFVVLPPIAASEEPNDAPARVPSPSPAEASSPKQARESIDDAAVPPSIATSNVPLEPCAPPPLDQEVPKEPETHPPDDNNNDVVEEEPIEAKLSTPDQALPAATEEPAPIASKSDLITKADSNAAAKKKKEHAAAKAEFLRELSSVQHVYQQYEVGKILGDGNFAVVKHCRFKSNSKEFAMKIIDKSKLKGKEYMVMNEIAIMRICDHKNIVKLVDEFETRKEIFLIMELVKGGDLFDCITSHVKFDEPTAAHMCRDLSLALFYLHSRSIVHRDMKPENIMVNRVSNSRPESRFTLKLADFGLAMEVVEPIYTVCGTPTYVAPEILMEIGYGLQIDCWALGVITYILLCGFPPFRSPERKQSELFELIKAGSFEFLSPYWDQTSDQAKDLIRRLLVVNQKKRYTTVDVLCHPWLITLGGSNPAPRRIPEAQTTLRLKYEAEARQNLADFRAAKATMTASV